MQCLYDCYGFFRGERGGYSGGHQSDGGEKGWKNNKIPIVAYRHVLITACRLTPRARDFKRLGRLDLGSPERRHTGYADTVRIRARNNTASRTGFDFITVRPRYPSSRYRII